MIFSLYDIFKDILGKKKFKLYGDTVDVIFDGENTVMPDFKIISDFSKIADGKNIKGAPDFIAEVLSPGNSSHDLIVKRKLYEKHGVKEYWIVDWQSKNIHAYVLNGGVYGDPTIYHYFTEEEIDDIERGVFNDYLREQTKITEIISHTFGEEIRVPIKKIFENI
jgi:Uma2 family endonuclease